MRLLYFRFQHTNTRTQIKCTNVAVKKPNWIRRSYLDIIIFNVLFSVWYVHFLCMAWNLRANAQWCTNCTETGTPWVNVLMYSYSYTKQTYSIYLVGYHFHLYCTVAAHLVSAIIISIVVVVVFFLLFWSFGLQKSGFPQQHWTLNATTSERQL